MTTQPKKDDAKGSRLSSDRDDSVTIIAMTRGQIADNFTPIQYELWQPLAVAGE